MSTQHSSLTTEIDSPFATEVLEGLNAYPKRLSSKYFYDAAGSKIFQEIMQMPSYYLTDCEFDIFQHHKHDILQLAQKMGKPFELVELGAGDGLKTKILLEHFLAQKADFTYHPIDISPAALKQFEAELLEQWPNLHVDPIADDYYHALEKLNLQASSTPKVILFLGSTLGNFEMDQAAAFLTNIRRYMTPQDMLFIGLDLKKEPSIILDAYSDSTLITSRFNLNLLTRINNSLGANFDINQFKHYASYQPLSGETRSFLISQQEQEVYIKALDTRITFELWEPISMELSQKYDLRTMEELAANSGFEVSHNFFDERNYFVDSVWTPV